MHPRISIHGICFQGEPYERLGALWRALGAQRVSLLGPQLAAEGIDAARAALAGGPFAVENVVQPLLAGPLPADPAHWEEPRARLAAVVEDAARLGARSVYVTTGGHGPGTWEENAARFAALISPVAARARDLGVALAVENAPFHNADIHIAHSLRDALALAELADLHLCIDLFGCWFEADLRRTLERALPRCALVQVSDYVFGDRAPAARAVPGDGQIPLLRLLDWILAAGYEGAFDLELFGPRIEAEGRLAAVGRAADRLGEMLVRLGA
ncbi:MAG: hypothetical protein KatS3mg124_0267 [Porticoccaceae bacterium]|nr:MAG: hypothetical protein KatS3mg124_0267 [Porticoccaceae bacterium]